MTSREKLIELLDKKQYQGNAVETSANYIQNSELADYLIENGVVVPPCKVGDTIYVLFSEIKEINEYKISEFVIGTKHDVIKFKDGSIYTIWDKDYDAHFGRTVFLTREEAEKALKEREENDE